MQTLSGTAIAELALTGLGFTELEGRLYCALLEGGPATGYRMAKRVGKAPPNVYQGLASLTQKGAVLFDDGEPRTWRAVPPAELLAAVGGAFETRRAEAEAALGKLLQPVADDRVWQISQADQVVERARAMLAGAREIVLFDLFDAPLALLRPDLEAAAARGVRVAGLTYGPTSGLEGVLLYRSARADVARARWPGAQLSLVVDAAEHLVALMAQDLSAVRHAVWSDSAYLSCLQHSGLSAEIRLAGIDAKAPAPTAGLTLLAAAPRGLRTLLGPEPLPETDIEDDVA